LTLIDFSLSILLALIFFMTGAFKLSGQKRFVENFQRWKYPASVQLTGGIFEITGAILLLIPRLTLYGAVILLGVMLMALYTHRFREKIPRNAIGPLILLIMIIFTGLLRGSTAIGPGGDLFRMLFPQ
jgi:uncharacterized membrane protein YphA (DoxX/SURF4 family)